MQTALEHTYDTVYNDATLRPVQTILEHIYDATLRPVQTVLEHIYDTVYIQ